MQEVDEKLEMLRSKKAEALLKHQKMPENIIEVNSIE